MALPNDSPPFDASKMPDLLEWIRQVNQSNTSRPITVGGKTVARLSPPKPERVEPGPEKSREARWQAFLSAAGTWSDVNTDDLLKNIYAARERSYRPQIEL